MGERVLVVGSGGREHELARQLDASYDVSEIICANGNAGTEQLTKAVNVDVKPTDLDGIYALAVEREVGLVVVGPEAPLVSGLTARLKVRNIATFGPSAEAARLEASKASATQFMQRHNIPHPTSYIATTPEEAAKFIKKLGSESSVIKADGLASGKGVVLPETDQESASVISRMFSGEGFDGAGKEKVVIQERYHGPEVSVFVVSDGLVFTVLPFSQDHKRLFKGDRGPNTGGMGAYSPLPDAIIGQAQKEKVYEIAERTIKGMAREGIYYQGLLYIGLMLAEEEGYDPVVIEYNCRFGDPETQVVLPVLSEAGVDVYDLLRSAAEGRLRDPKIPIDLGKAALTVCLAAEGYPSSPQTGEVVHGIDTEYPGVIFHHAGTKKVNDEIVSAGGRVLYVTGIGNTIDTAAANAYSAIGNGKGYFKGWQYRSDIGHQARS